MVFLTQEECARWLDAHGIARDATGKPETMTGLRERLRVWLPQNPGPRVELCRALWQDLTEGDEVLVWVTDWGTWTSGEPIVSFVRRGLGTNDPLDSRPGCATRPEESEAGLSMMILAAFFGWDCWVVSSSVPPVIMTVSKDQWISVHGTPAQRMLVESALLALDVEVDRPDRQSFKR